MKYVFGILFLSVLILLPGCGTSGLFGYFEGAVVTPVVTSISPNGGPLAGGTSVTITGKNFKSGMQVTFGQLSCSSVNVVSSTSVTCLTPSNSAGLVDVTLSNPLNKTKKVTGGFTYRDAPTVSSISPNAGPIAGNTLITVTGTGFVSGATVSLGGSDCTGVSLSSSTSLTCTTSSHAAGAVTATVTNTDTQSGDLTSAYTYQPAPTISSVSPSAGPLAGGTAVTLTGTGFLTGATVSFGGSPCSAVTVSSSTSISCTTTAHVAGLVSVSVTNTDAQSGSLSSGYTYQAAPTVTAVTPSAGALAGGTAVTITGTGFLTGATVSFGGSSCDSVTVVSATSITCTTSAHSAGPVLVTVTNADTQPGSLSNGYTYQTAPTVLSVSPVGGPITGGTSVTVTGRDFLSGATVSFGGSACTGVIVVSSTSITCTTPANAAGAVTVSVTNSDAQSGSLNSAYTYQGGPTVTSVSPSAGSIAGGTSITVTGTGFLNGATVSLGGSSCSGVVVGSSTSLTCTTSSHSVGAVTATVTNTDLQSGSLVSAFTYQNAPTVTSVSPNVGAIAGGTLITLTGTGFLSGALVDVGGVSCSSPTVVSATSITCTTGAHASGLVNVVVTNTDLQTGTLSNGFTYLDTPTISSISPTSGPTAGGTSLIITGTNFTDPMTASVGGSTCTGASVLSATQISCTTPPGTSGLADVTVTNAASLSGTLAASYTYIPAPTVTLITPTEGPLAGNTPVTITGTGFLNGATVSLGGSPCSGVTVSSSTSISCTTSAHVAGLVSVTVTNTDTQSGTLSNAYTYQSSPTVTAVTPSAGALAGATAVTITGTGFLTGATVSFGGSACNSVTVVSATSITCTTTAHTAGPVLVTVTNTDNQPGSLANGYTYQKAPTVLTSSPPAGALGGGTAMTITGRDFLSGATVSVGGSDCDGVVVVSSTSITCTTTAHAAATVDVTVTNLDSQSGTLAAVYTYQPAPSVTSVSPDNGALAGGTAVTLTGTGFLSGATVSIGGTACTAVSVDSATSITCTTPAHAAGAVTVSVTNTDTQTGSLSSGYTYNPFPTITTATPAAGALAGGTSVSITGTGFLAGATVTFGGSSATSVSVVSATLITCNTPAHAAGAVDVVVTNTDTQSATDVGAYTYQPAPTVSSISPSSGSVVGGDSVTISGTGFLSGATVTIGGVAATGVFINSSISISATTPSSNSTGAVDIVVTNSDGQFGTLAGGFTYTPAACSNSVSAARPDDCYNEGTSPNYAQGLAIGTLRLGPGGTTLTLQYANGSSGFKVWIEQSGTRILNATGLVANGWQQTLTRGGTAFSGSNFTTASSISGRVCPPSVFLNFGDMIATDRCLYYDGGNSAQSLDQDSGGTEAEDWLTFWDRAATGQGSSDSYYEGNIKTCADKGMRLPVAYETRMNTPGSLPTGDSISPTWAGSSKGVPSSGGATLTASASPSANDSYLAWSGTTSSTDIYSSAAQAVRCVLP